MNKEANSLIKAKWDAFTSLYDQVATHYTYQAYVTLLVHAKVNEKFCILDLACGSGAH